MSSRFRFGLAGWSYPDWEGIVYPRGRVDHLAYCARFFDVIEVNTTYYRPVPEKMAQSWLRRVEAVPEFRFSVKLWQRFTHSLEPFGRDEINAVTPVLRLMSEHGRLAAVLIQFPYSFKNAGDARERLDRLLDAFAPFPLVVEIRHASFNVPGFFEYLRERRIGFCNIDQPLISRSIEPTAIVTAGIGYVRLHGRNDKEWFNERGDAASRYDYLYSIDELREWAGRIVEIGRQASDVYIIANNHYRGQAPANSLQLKGLLTRGPVAAPPSLADAFPALREFTTSTGPGERALFDE